MVKGFKTAAASTRNTTIRRSLSKPKPRSSMTERIARFDWSRTPLGAMVDWPENLRTAVAICLANPVPTFVWWGSELINIYNDAYAPFLGGRHPSALGAPGRKVRAAVWTILAKDVDAAVNKGVSVVRDRVRIVLKRKGFPDEMFFTYTLSPISSSSGEFSGLFQIAIDETARVAQERRFKVEHDHKAAMSDNDATVEESLLRWQAVVANMAEGVILADPEGHLVDWNRAALDMHGYTDAQAAKIHLTEIANDFVLTEPNGIPVPFDQWPMSRLLRGEPVRNFEAHVHRRSSGENLVLIYNGTNIRDAKGAVRFVLLTLHNATESRLAGLHNFPIKRKGVLKVTANADTRSAEHAVKITENLLYNMDLTLGEREFCKSLGQHLVQVAIDAYLKTIQQSTKFEGSCVAASLAIAMIIVNDL